MLRGKVWIVSICVVIFGFGLVTGFIGLPANAQEKVVITEWDEFGYEGDEAAGYAMDELLRRFEKKYPNIQVIRSIMGATLAIRASVRLALPAGAAPDVFCTWPAAAVLSGYAKAGYLYDLTSAAQQLGWFDKLPEIEIDRCSYNGRLYAYPQGWDLMVVYYNKDIFSELGLNVPENYAQFLTVGDKIKKAGYIPIAFGNKGQWPATNTLALLLALTAGKEKEEEVLFGNARWDRPEFVNAAKIFLDWVNRGYFPEGFNGMTYAEENVLFTSGQAAMNITGTWILQELTRSAPPFELGVFFFPQIYDDLPLATMTGEGAEWSISADTKHPEESIKFVNFLTLDENMDVWAEKGSVIPMRKNLDVSQFNVPELIKKVYRKGGSLMDVNGYDLHTTVSERVSYVLYNDLQKMLAGYLSPTEFSKHMQESWDEAKAAGEVWYPN